MAPHQGDRNAMAIEITVPTLGESVADATVARWIKTTGDAVAADEPVVELETDKVTLEVPAPVAGTLGEIIAAEGANVEVGAVLAIVNEGDVVAAATPAPAKEAPAKEAPAAAPVMDAAPASATADMPLSPAVERQTCQGEAAQGEAAQGEAAQGKASQLKPSRVTRRRRRGRPARRR